MLQSKSVLVVEDDEGIRETMQVLLEIEGYSVVTAADGQQGLDALSRMPRPGLILLDLMMPVMNGWEFAEALSHTEYANAPVVIVTAYGEQGVNLKCDGIIRKPIDVNTLLKTVEKWCGAALDRSQQGPKT
jgi:CheY-like chemotaxis protein